MRIVKKINNNVALAQDAQGADLVVFGCGVGYPATPYELDDPTKVERVFRGVDESVLGGMGQLDERSLRASSQIVDLALASLNCKLNPNLVFTLADHLQFSLDRMAKGIEISNPLAPEVSFVYPRETKVGFEGIDVIEECCGVRLPNDEAYSIALHLVNAEGESASPTGNMDVVMKSAGIIEHVTAILEDDLGIHVARDSYEYARFVGHLRYLVSRLMKGLPAGTSSGSLFRQAARDFPESYLCASDINAYLRSAYGWGCSDEELLYLMMHINRLRSGR